MPLTIIVKKKDLLMSNICENTIRVFSENEDNLNYICHFIKREFNSNLEQIDSESLEGYFDSRNVFPEQEMEELYEKLPNKEDTIVIEVLSIEWSSYYCVFHVCDNKGWMLV